MLSYPVVLSISAVALVLLSAMVYVSGGGLSGALVVVALAGCIIFILQTFGAMSISTGPSGVGIDFHEKIPSPHQEKREKAKPLSIKEVFHISGNNYTFEEAPAVCAAYGAELATYDQLTEAFSLGAEWCGYGWSAAAMALYPTQEATWSALQMNPKESSRTACGRPGVNGGYFDPKMKFGVNCYGVKPKNHGTHLPLPLPGADSKGFNKMVNKFKAMMNSITLSPFNRDIWSETNIGAEVKKKTAEYISGAEEKIQSDWSTGVQNIEAGLIGGVANIANNI